MMLLIILILFILAVPYLFTYKPKSYCLQEPPDFILVLGCPTDENGSLSQKQKERLDACCRDAKKYHCDHIVISGGAVHNRYTEAVVMADALKALLPHCRIDTECQARNTFQNIKFTKEQFGKTHILVITSPAHYRRAYFFVRKFYPQAAMGTVIAKDPLKEYIKEYFRLWNALYWEIRLRIFHS